MIATSDCLGTYWVVRVYGGGTECVTMRKVESLMSQVEQGAIGDYAEDFTRPLAYFSILTFKPPMLKVPAAPISTSGYQELSKKPSKRMANCSRFRCYPYYAHGVRAYLLEYY